MKPRALLVFAALLAGRASADSLPLYGTPSGPLRMVMDSLNVPAITVPAARAAETPVPAPVKAKPKARGPKMHGAAGGIVSLATETDSAVEPWAWIDIDVPVADAPMAPSMLVELGLSALPGAQVNAADPATFHAIEAHIGLAQPIAPILHFDLYVEGVFATRLPGDARPRNGTARGISGGLRFRSSKGSLALGIGADQRLTGEYRPAMTLRGAYKLWQIKDGSGAPKAGGVQMSLVGDAILGLDAPTTGSSYGRDVVRVGVACGF